MQGLVYRKSCTVAIVVLFIGISIAPSISGSIGELSTASLIEEVSDISSKLKKTHENDIDSYDESAVFESRLFDTDNSFGKTIYVDDDAVPPYYGTEENPYKTIHDGINTSFDGDIIFVYNGIYYEDNLTINKSISLIGENKENTIIDGSYIEKEYSYIICILANRVNINGFTIQNCGEHIKGISVDSQNNSVLNNIFKNNYIGIWIRDSINNISGNNFVDNRICILSSHSFITISKNYFSNNSYGIDYSGGRHNIFGNIFTKCFMGIYTCGASSNDIISQNEFTNCNTGIKFIAASSSIISNNNLSSNCYGIKLDGSASKNNIFCDNLISDNSNYGIFIQIYRDRLNNIFYHNEFISNKQHAYEVLPNMNIWGGNYWDDYTGVDNNYDGIGDKPYCIPPPENENKDWYPIISREYWPNIPPQPPIISGNQSGKPGGVYECEIEIFDLDEDQIYFLFDWGDGTNSGWVGPYKSGEIILLNHTWFNRGLYRLKAKAKDKFGIEGYWSEYFPIIIIKTRKLVFGNTLYVDDDNTEGPWDGTQEHPYQHVQDAISNAIDGDTVYVYGGTYFENVIVDKSIELTGEDRDTTIIDGGGTGYVIYVTADTVTVDGFTIQNSGIGSERAGICIINNNILISNNIISNNEDGIRLIDSEYTEISSNILNNNQDDDIVIRDYSNNNIVSGNKIISCNEAGIILYISNRDNIILDNTISNHDYGIVICYSSNFNTVSNNAISKNNLGICIHDSSSTNKIYHNNLVENTQNAYDECTNAWDNGKKGNYWDDYEERCPDAHKKWLRGIWDTPYDIPDGDNHDIFPLTKPYSKSKSYVNPVFLQFLENHPRLFSIIEHLFGL